VGKNGKVIPLIAVNPNADEAHEIAERAFELWLQRELRHGSPTEHLIEAMFDVRASKSVGRLSQPFRWNEKPSKRRANVTPIR
jgi:hypothetical protein